jgi:hypothetical protein
MQKRTTEGLHTDQRPDQAGANGYRTSQPRRQKS